MIGEDDGPGLLGEVWMDLVFAVGEAGVPVVRFELDGDDFCAVEPVFEAIVRNADASGVPLTGGVPFAIGGDGDEFVETGGAMSGVFVIAVVVAVDDLILATDGAAIDIGCAVLDAAVAIVGDVEFEF